jgi:hypothetical protein
MIVDGETFIFGAVPPQKIINLPPHTLRIKLRLRPLDFALAYVKTPGVITCYYLTMTKNGNWKLDCPRASNITRCTN